MYNGKVIIGVGGTIGSGKTTACEIMCTMGAFYISADEIGRGILPEIALDLQEHFGPKIMKGKEVDREKLAEVVFTEKEALSHLNNISHPVLKKRLKDHIRNAPCELVVIDAALLFDWPDIMEIVDYPVLITAPETLKQERCIARGMDLVQYQKIRMNQKDDATLSDKARFIINNNGTVEDLHDRCRSIIKEIKHGH